MVIKDQTDVAFVMKERLNDIMHLCDGDRHAVIEMYLEAYFCLCEAEKCKEKYRWARRDETKDGLKKEFNFQISGAQACLDEIDKILYSDGKGEA